MKPYNMVLAHQQHNRLLEVSVVSFTPTSKAIGHKGQNLWSCVRNNRHAAWYANGNNGFFNGNNLQNGNLAVPLSNR